jgi:hypothetical protein
MAEDIGEFLTDLLGKPPRRDIVEYLSKRGAERLMGLGEKGEEELLDEYLALESQFPAPVTAGPRVIEIPGDDRLAALSRILAMDASRRSDVVDFRKRRLRGKLLEPEKVTAWVKAHGSAALGRERAGVEAAATRVEGLPAWENRYPANRLYYRDPTADVVRSAGLRPESPLAELKAIAAELSAVHNVWEEPRAATFILTGTPPSIPLARAEIYRNDLWPSETRALVIIDPVMPPSLPIRVLSDVREALLPVGTQRQTAMSKKHAELAVRGEMKRGEPGKPWAALLSEWNSEYPDWAYKDRTAEVHFARDVRSAWTRVTGREWK